MDIHYISSERLTIERVGQLLANKTPIALSAEACERITRCRDYLDSKMESQKEPIYGITTGFGSLCNISISADELGKLQNNLVMSHACGTGEGTRGCGSFGALRLLRMTEELRGCGRKCITRWEIRAGGSRASPTGHKFGANGEFGGGV